MRAVRHWLVITLVSLTWLVATGFLFVYPSTSTFGIWSSVVATITGAYHWIAYCDSKIKDPPP